MCVFCIDLFIFLSCGVGPSFQIQDVFLLVGMAHLVSLGMVITGHIALLLKSHPLLIRMFIR